MAYFTLRFVLTSQFLLLSILSLSAQQWHLIKEDNLTHDRSARQIIPDVYTTYHLDIENVRDLLDEVSKVNQTNTKTITFPVGGSDFQEFVLERRDVFHPDLAAKYPEIQAYTGYNINNPSQKVKLSMSPFGMDAMFLGGNQPQSYIDVYAKGDDEHYISYLKSEYPKKEQHEFTCTVEDPQDGYKPPVGDLRYGDCTLRTYRLALACTGEYANFHGGTTTSVLAAYNTAMNRVNGIYERDAAITMQLIANTDMLIFFDGATDPYDNNDGGAMLGQNQNVVDQTIGTANYDIGHVFSTGGGGVASLRSPCNSNRKARGVTGLGSPVNDGFYVDYVAHEMGHQFGGNHCYNNSCGGNRNGSTAVEPGSGATIMAYAGICSPNVQNNSDDYFHTVNLEEIANFVVAGNGGCAVETPLSNTPPIIESVGVDVVIPGRTPFALTAIATDEDTVDMLTYTWEQMDIEIANMPPESNATGGPAFRSYDPNTSPTRYFPRLSNILNGSNGNTWEVLPTVDRQMNFRATVRDNAMGGGCTDFDDVVITIDGDSGPFVVTEPTNATVWNSGGSATVNWDVAGTDQAPVNCELVDIYLSTGTKRNFDVLLASGVPNNGSFEVAIPSINTTLARVMVKCATNIFLDINAGDFAIIAPFSVEVDNNEIELCPGDTQQINLDYIPNNDFAETTTFTTENVPMGMSVILSNETLIDSSIVSVDLLSDASVEPGVYQIDIIGTSASANSRNIITVKVGFSANQIITNPLPMDGSRGVDIVTTLSWDDIMGNLGYNVQIATDAGFNNIVKSETVNANSYLLNGLETATVYYWRVAVLSPCFDLAYLGDQAFQTGGLSCQSYTSEENITITEEDNNDISSTIDVTDQSTIGLVNIGLTINHSYVGDLTGSITSPEGETVNLFDRAGVPESNFGCARDNMSVKFTDIAQRTYDDFEMTCDNGDFAIEGDFQPITVLSAYSAKEAQGAWTLGVTDFYDPDGGMLSSWFIEVCQSSDIDAGLVVNNNDLNLVNVSTTTINSDNISIETMDESSTIYMIKETPLFGSIQYLDAGQGGFVSLSQGDVFTQQNISDGNVRYQFEGTDQTADQVVFDIVNDQQKWVLDEALAISIDIGMLTASANVTSSISCAGDSNGAVELMGAGGLVPYTFSLDGANYQAANSFSDLMGGAYIGYVKDGAGEVAEVEFVISDPVQITATVDVQREVVTVNALGGTGTLMYSTDNMVFQTENVFLLDNQTTYTVYIQDENECSIEIMTEVNYVEDFALLVTNAVCNNEETGTIEFQSVVGGPEPYMYRLDFGLPQTESIFSNLPSGIYNAAVEDANGVTTSKQVTVSQPSPYNVSVDTLGSTATINVVGNTSPYTYSLDSGEAQEENVFEELLNGTYQVTVLDANGCSIIVDFTIQNSTVSTNFISPEKIKIYPNPTIDKLTIDHQNQYKFDKVQIFDVNGKKIYDAVYSSTLDVSNLLDGVYLLKLLNDDEEGSFKFVKSSDHK